MPYEAPVADQKFIIRHVARACLDLPDGTQLDDGELERILAEAGRFVAERIAPQNQAFDRAGAIYDNGAVRTPHGMREAYGAWIAAGWNGIALPPAFGGAGLPLVVGTACMEMLTSACMALATLPVLTQAAVHALHAHADDAIKRAYLPKLVSGAWTAAMALTEPQAGTDLRLLRCRAYPVPGGAHRLTGQKVFITFGEHDLAENVVHLALARLPGAPEGTRGISLFLVPKVLPDGSRNDLRCAGIEHKLGIRASPTCVMIYGEGGGALAWLVGEPHRGLAAMFTMMNEARLATGLQGVAIAERAWQQAIAYARSRRQGHAAAADPAPIVAHPDVQRMLARMKALTAASRCLAYLAAAEIDRARYATDAGSRDQAGARAGLLTPLVKAFATDAGVEVTSLGIQVHGGAGYVEDTGAAQHWRDARIAPIYEGTNGIQAVDLVMRRIARDGAGHIQRLVAECRADLEVAAPVLGASATTRLAAAVEALAAAIRWLADPARSDEQKLYAATGFLRLFGLALGGCLLARAACAADEQSTPTDWPALARVYAEDVVPEAVACADTLMSAGRSPALYASLLAAP